jgi:outer membrane receptor protein involved in Fe transport
MRFRPRRPSADIATAVSEVLRTLAICAPVALGGAPCAQGSPARGADSMTLAADIPAQSLARALEAFASQTGLQLVYVSGVVRDQRSHPVPAGLGADDALAQILQATGLTFQYLTPHSIRILAAAVGPPPETTTRTRAEEALQEVIVTANRRVQNLQDVPITIQVLTGETLTRLNATTFDDFVRYLPAVTAHGGWGVGSSVGSYGCGIIRYPTAPDPCVNGRDQEFINLNAENLDRTYSGFRSRANLSWKITEDALLYYTWSQGFRAGGFNRSASCGCRSPFTPGPYSNEAQARQNGGWYPGLTFAPDTLTNNECEALKPP